MKWFFNWLYAGLKNVEAQEREEGTFSNQAGFVARPRGSKLKIGLAKSTDMSADGQHVNLNQSPLVFRLYPATGGYIVEYSFYNEKTDMNQQALHLIPSDADLGESISKIMTLEALKR
jgi:hypothetical protein